MTLPGLTARRDTLAELPGLGLLTLARMLPSHWSCSYHTITEEVESLLETLVAEKPDLIAMSALTASIEQAYRCTAQLRKENLQVVIGGLHATACPAEIQRSGASAVVGEGEAVWRQVLDDAECRELKAVYRSSEALGSPRWPAPRLDLLPAAPPRYTLQTQRGCPLACEFCGASRLLSKYREKPLAKIERELSAIVDRDVRPVVELADDNTFVRRSDLPEFFEAFALSGVRYFTEADWRIGTRPEILEPMATSGCVQLLMGIESLVFRYPGMGKKSESLNQILDAVERVQDAGIAVNGCFIIGAEGETQESIGRLIDFVLRSPFADVQLTLQTPFPGTPLYDRLRRAGRIIPQRGWSYYTLFDVTYVPDKMSINALEASFENALLEVYSASAASRRRAIRQRIWSKHPHFNRQQRR